MNSAARIEAFLEMMSAERGAAENTLASYRRDLEDASRDDRAAGSPTPPPPTSAPISATSPHAGFAPTSQARKLSALRQFYKFLYAEGLRADDPTGTLDSPRKDRPLPKTMSEAETGRLLDRAALEAGEARGDGDAAAGTAHACAGRGALRHRPARLRTGRPAGDAWRCATSASSWCAARATRSAWCRCRPRRATRCAPG